MRFQSTDPALRPELAALQRFLHDEAVDLKHADAVMMIRVIAERIADEQPWRPPERPQRERYEPCDP